LQQVLAAAFGRIYFFLGVKSRNGVNPPYATYRFLF